MKVTYYHLDGITASGELTSEIDQPFAAVSRDLVSQYQIGSKILLYHCDWEGVYIVKDKMAKRHKNTVDIYSKENHFPTQYCKCKLLDQ